MKEAFKNRTIKTIPKGVWEGSRPQKEEKIVNDEFTVSTDLQGNGYPADKKSK